MYFSGYWLKKLIVFESHLKCFTGVPTAFALARLTDTGGRKIVSSKGKPQEKGEYLFFLA